MALLDPSVARAKFEAEVAAYRRIESELLPRGWWMLEAEFPEVFVVFAAAKTKPPVVVFGAVIDFTDYDLMPASVRLVDPFTRARYPADALPTLLLRRPAIPEQFRNLPPGTPLPLQPQPLMQAYPGEKPFLCLPGVREYHEHPAHSADSWLSHRGTGVGTLFFLLEKLYRYGVEQVTHVNYEIQFRFAGYNLADVPE